MRKLNLGLVLVGLVMCGSNAHAQTFKEGYVEWGKFGIDFANTASTWQAGTPVNEDDNFFISRVKPRARFENKATQVNPAFGVGAQSKVLAWVPWNDPGVNALPDGKFDSEVFSIWSYVDHWGNWSAPLGRVPGSLMDVAHKNGVAVSSVAGIPWGGLGSDWKQSLTNLANVGAEKIGNLLYYYGVDGLGYNSEFSGGSSVMPKIIPFHQALVAKMKPLNPIFENLWYDGTNDYGSITFDQGLRSANDDVFKGASLFFNYNWYGSLLRKSASYAEGMGKSRYDLYAGMNMQGGQGTGWSELQANPISIGLWGAHSKNMMWESRGEKGSSPETQQATYMLRTERWYTGGSRNPVNTPPVINSLRYSADNYNFHGISKFTSAKSTLSWDLTEEPFITYFNLGNGKFFNWMGERQHDGEWANVAVQDYLPTWRWWFTSTLLGRQASDVPANGMDAEFVWDEAYVGGSSLRLYGSTSAPEYLHLFKTKYALKDGDKITVRYKIVDGTTTTKLVLTAEGAESTEIAYDLMDGGKTGKWAAKEIVVGSELAGKTLALIALKFEKADNADIRLGEMSIVRTAATKPAMPENINAKVLSFNSKGVDAKITWNMANDKAPGQPCYNIDVKTSVFKLYAQQTGQAPVLMGITTSWAGLLYQIPTVPTGENKIKIGVSALSLDMKSESDIAWSQEFPFPAYVYSDEIEVSKAVIKPNEAFEVAFIDPRHETGTWEIKDAQGQTVKSGSGLKIEVKDGLPAEGLYDVVVTAPVYSADGSSRPTVTRTFSALIPITSETVGALPEIYTLTANGGTETVTTDVNKTVDLAYTGRYADGTTSRGINLKEKVAVMRLQDAGFADGNSSQQFNRPWTLSFWVKFNSFNGGTQIVDFRDQADSWPQNNWGCFWSTYDPNSSIYTTTIRQKWAGGSDEYTHNWKVKFTPDVWSYLTIVQESDGNGVRTRVYVNGQLAEAKDWKINSYKKGTGMNNEFLRVTMMQPDPYMLLGGNRGGTNPNGSIDGVIDDVRFYTTALTADDVKKLFKNAPDAPKPEGLWDFETEYGNDLKFASTGTMPSLKLAYAQIAEGSNEGQGSFKPIESVFYSGSPFTPGTAYVVTTTVKWDAINGTLTNQTGDAKAGSAKVAYAADGDYTVTLTMANSYGKDVRSFPVIKVGTPSGVAGVEANQLRAYTVGEDLFVDCAEAGQYNFAVYGIDGAQVLNQNLSVATGNKVRLHLPKAGVYVLKVAKDGKTLRSVKLIRK
ncbi:endo-beta-N-acetylglucosaminidase [Prevotella sp. SGI.027]